MNVLPKVTALITRSTPDGEQLLLFRHPFAGVQIPAGTVEEDEPLEQAVLREAAEETGLNNLRIVACLGERDELPFGASHVILRTTQVYSRPDRASYSWAILRRGIAVRALRRQEPLPPDPNDQFLQVTYQENDSYPDASYITYQITGWVPAPALADASRRTFYHLRLPPTETLPDTWAIRDDHHSWNVFWAALDALPEIVSPQRAWVQYLLQPPA